MVFPGIEKITLLVPGSLPRGFWSSQPPLRVFLIVRVWDPMVRIPPFSMVIVLRVTPEGRIGSFGVVAASGMTTWLGSDGTPVGVQLVDTFQEFEVNGVLHARKEEIGVLCADQTLMGTPAILTDDTYDLVMSFKGKRFDIDEVSAFAGISKDDAVTLCSALVRDKVFVPIS